MRSAVAGGWASRLKSESDDEDNKGANRRPESMFAVRHRLRQRGVWRCGQEFFDAWASDRKRDARRAGRCCQSGNLGDLVVSQTAAMASSPSPAVLHGSCKPRREGWRCQTSVRSPLDSSCDPSVDEDCEGSEWSIKFDLGVDCAIQPSSLGGMSVV